MSTYEETGILLDEDLKQILPPRERLEKGPVAIVECIQMIPCEPCVYACRFDAMKKRSVVEPPEVDYDRCTGCGECVAVCPGLAIFVVNLNYTADEALLIIPYEFSPTPKKGETYEALDRQGEIVGKLRIVATREMADHTVVLLTALQKDLAMTVRNIGRRIE